MPACKRQSAALPVLTYQSVRSAPVLADHRFRLGLTKKADCEIVRSGSDDVPAVGMNAKGPGVAGVDGTGDCDKLVLVEGVGHVRGGDVLVVIGRDGEYDGVGEESGAGLGVEVMVGWRETAADARDVGFLGGKGDDAA